MALALAFVVYHPPILLAGLAWRKTSRLPFWVIVLGMVMTVTFYSALLLWLT
jgi:hypothetical protein